MCLCSKRYNAILRILKQKKTPSVWHPLTFKFVCMWKLLLSRDAYVNKGIVIDWIIDIVIPYIERKQKFIVHEIKSILFLATNYHIIPKNWVRSWFANYRFGSESLLKDSRIVIYAETTFLNFILFRNNNYSKHSLKNEFLFKKNYICSVKFNHLINNRA